MPASATTGAVKFLAVTVCEAVVVTGAGAVKFVYAPGAVPCLYQTYAIDVFAIGFPPLTYAPEVVKAGSPAHLIIGDVPPLTVTLVGLLHGHASVNVTGNLLQYPCGIENIKLKLVPAYPLFPKQSRLSEP